ncbi:MAG: Hpt domain-containing protein [Bacteroidetes bacterium]|nr:Hpt domain-containing protein [Bacteroidota bacterium]
MIDWEKFNEYFRYFDKTVVDEIIDLFFIDFPERMEKIQTNIEEKDFENLFFNAHWLKGVLANFWAPSAIDLARKLEEIGRLKTDSGMAETFNKLRIATNELLAELQEFRNKKS